MKKVLFLLSLSMYVFANDVTVSILPQKYFVEKIVGDKMIVNVMVKPGSNPVTYEPKVSQMKKLINSKIYFSIGVPFESVWLERFRDANKNMAIVDTSKNIKRLEMLEHTHESHDEHEHEDHEHESHDANKHESHDDHEHEEHKHANHDEHDHDEHEHESHDEHEHEEHEHDGLDPHIWLDPMLVKVQAKTILDAVVKIDAKNSAFYQKNYELFLEEIDVLNKKIEVALTPLKNRAFMVFHPSWGYFSKRYNLEQIAIEVQGKEPKLAKLGKIIDEAKEHKIKVVFTSPQFSKSSAEIISKNIGGKVQYIDPLALNWNENLLKVANEISK